MYIAISHLDSPDSVCISPQPPIHDQPSHENRMVPRDFYCTIPWDAEMPCAVLYYSALLSSWLYSSQNTSEDILWTNEHDPRSLLYQWSQFHSNSRPIYTFDPQLFVAISPPAADLFCGGTKCVTKCLRNICKMMKDSSLLHVFTITTKIANGGTVPLCFREHYRLWDTSTSSHYTTNRYREAV